MTTRWPLRDPLHRREFASAFGATESA